MRLDSRAAAMRGLSTRTRLAPAARPAPHRSRRSRWLRS